MIECLWCVLLHAHLSYFPRQEGDNWWSQERGGFESVEHDWGSTVAGGVLVRQTEYRIGYPSGYSQAVAFTRDDSNYNSRNANGCNGDCLPTTWGYNRQDAVTISAIRYFDYVGIGLDLERVDWRHVRYEPESGDYAKRFTRKYHTIDYVAGLRVAFVWRWFELEYTRQVYLIDREGVCCPPSSWTVSVGPRTKF